MVDLEKGEAFYPWECLSIFRSDYTSLDLVIRDMKVMMCLLHVLHLTAFTPENPNFMRCYKIMKF